MVPLWAFPFHIRINRFLGFPFFSLIIFFPVENDGVNSEYNRFLIKLVDSFVIRFKDLIYSFDVFEI